MSAWRLAVLSGAAASTAWTEAGVSALAGAVLDGQYELHGPIAGTLSALVEVDAHGRYPAELRAEFGEGHYLRSGSFGEAWEAYDNGVKVVLKLFYRKSGGVITYLTKNNLTPDERGAVGEAVTECQLARNIVDLAPRADPGTQRVVNCRKDRVSGRAGSQPLYLVLDHGGMSVEQWIQLRARSATTLEKRTVVGMLLQGLRTMGELLPRRLVHHDLKPANAVYDGKTAQLIDFGGTMEGSATNMYARAVATLAYAPPEFLGLVPGRAKVAFELPAVSYDMYAMGMIYAEIMCAGKVDYRDLYQYARSSSKSAAALARILTGKGCSISQTDVDAMLPMLAFRARDRPLPSAALSGEPFSRPEMQAALGERAEELDASVDGGDDLVASLVPKDGNNPNVRGGRGVLVNLQQDALLGWQTAMSCESKYQTPLMQTSDFASMSGTRGQCEVKCIAHEAAHRADLFAQMSFDTPDKSSFCCQLNVLGSDGNGRSCQWGYGKLVSHVATDQHSNAYARLLPLTGAPKRAPRRRIFDPLPSPPGRGRAGRVAEPDFRIGDLVRMRMDPTDTWRHGVVTRTYPQLEARPDGWDRGLTWVFIERADAAEHAGSAPRARREGDAPAPVFFVGQRVRMRSRLTGLARGLLDAQPWFAGVVAEVAGPHGGQLRVLKDGWSTAFVWDEVEPLPDVGEPLPAVVPPVRVGDHVRIKDQTAGYVDRWRYGVVTAARPVVQVRQNGFPAHTSFTYAFVEKLVLKPGDRVTVRTRADVRDGGAHQLPSWQDAVVTSGDLGGLSAAVRVDGQARDQRLMHYHEVEPRRQLLGLLRREGSPME